MKVRFVFAAVCAAALACGTPTWAQWRSGHPPHLPPVTTGGLPPALQQAFGDALSGLGAAGQLELQVAHRATALGDHATAAAAFERLLKAVEAQVAAEGLRDEDIANFLADLLPPYAKALSELGRWDEAALLLERALRAEDQSQTRPDAARSEAFMRLGRIQSAGREISRAMNASIVVAEGERATDVYAFLAPRVPNGLGADVMLAEARARQGRGSEVRELWDKRIQPRVRRQLERGWIASWPREIPIASIGPSLYVGDQFYAEADLLRAGNALAATGAWREAYSAYDQALAVNLDRLRTFTALLPVQAMQAEGFQMRRLIVSAAVAAALQAGTDAARTSQVVAAIASTKALAARSAAHRRALLTTAPERLMVSTREAVENLELQLLRLPLSGDPAFHAWAQWQGMYTSVLGPVMPVLQRRGVAALFTGGEATLEQTKAKLGDEAWIGYMVYTPLEPGRSAISNARYVRYTIAGGEVTLADIGAREEIDRAVARWRSIVGEGAAPPPGDPLAEALLRNLPAGVRASKSWVVEPDGILALVPFEALQDGKGLVADTRRVRYATSMAQFASPGVPATTKQEALVLADSVYDDQAPMQAWGTTLRSARSDASELRFAALPETRIEADMVQKALAQLGLTTRVALGKEATPTTLAGADAPRILHVASHAFVLTPQPAPVSRARGLSAAVVVPGRLAGLALTPGPDDDGIVLAQEVAGLNLRGTQLVVLSACDTGNGLVDVGEGLMGLRRAVEEAGARSSLTSLWPVPSELTVGLMQEFYRSLSDGKSHSASLRDAKLKLRREGAPMYAWAGFVLAGEDQ